MNDRSTPAAHESSAPYGTQPRRPVWPVVAWCALFGAWFIVLLWMALFHVGAK